MTIEQKKAPALIPPHGGHLVDQYASPEKAKGLAEEAKKLPRVVLNARQISDAHMIAQGAFSPLEGFMTRDQYRQVVQHMHLPNGLPWSIPVTLSVETDARSKFHEGRDVALTGADGVPLGVLHLQEVYSYNKEQEALLAYRTKDAAHPGVANLYQQGDLLLGGPITLFRAPKPDSDVVTFYRTPRQTREEFARLGWRTVVAFQTRNPVHRAHEYIQKVAMEVVDGLLLHPLVGETKSDDIPASVRMRCYQVLLEHYYPKDRVLLSVFPAFMRYAGPREAIFHAIVRKNYGCTHFIVGRDHAGVGNYYGTFDAQHIFREFSPEELGITPLFFDNAFFCRQCGGMATIKTCPHAEKERISLSGTQVRTLLSKGELPPPEYSRPEVARVLVEATQPAKAAPGKS